jgi:8-oxo-dGTP pyrophosphatase MutT (NUDIX family)/GNAT superfamily N-acetyltransferase
MDPQDLANIIKALDELVETAIKDTVNNRDFDGLNLLDYVNNQSYTYDDLVSLFPRDDGLLVFGPYDLESLVGAGRSDLNLVIEPIVSDADETIEKIRVSLRDQNTVGSSGPNNFRQDIDKLFMLDLGEFSTVEEMENLFTQTSDVDGTTAKVSLVGDKLDEIFPNSTANIEMALTNQMPIVSDRIRQEINRDFVPDYIKEAFELIDKEQATQYSELAGDVDIPDTPEGAADAVNVTDEAENIFDDTLERLRNANDKFVDQQLDDVMAQKINEILPLVNTDLSKAEAVGIRVPPGGPDITTSKDPVLNAFADELGKYAMGEELNLSAKRKLWGFMWSAATNDKYGLINEKKSFIPELQDGVDASKLDNTGYLVWKNWQHSGSFRPQSLIGMTANEFDAFGPPPYVRLLDGLDKEYFEKTGEYLFQSNAVSEADVIIPEGVDTPTNIVDEITELENSIRSKYSDYLEKDIVQEYYASDPNNSGKLDTPLYKKRGISLSYLEGDINRDFPYNKKTLFIDNLYIDETQRGQGIGSQIFDEIKKFADDNGLYIRLWNDEEFNTTFWEKKGFGIYETPRNPNRSWERTLPNYVLAPKGETLPDTPNRLDTPTNVVDETALREKEIAGITNDYVQNNWNEPKTTGDAIVMRVNDDGVPEILMIERTNPPHTDKWALPGGIVDQEAKDFMDSAGQKDIDQLSELGEKNKQLFFKAHERSDRKYIKYVILNELMEEVGLDVVDKNLDLKFLGVKNNRFDWDARATKGVSVGGGFIFIEDNTWEPKAGSDAKNAKWIKLKDIVDKKVEVAFGHVEWIVNALQDRSIGLNYFGNSFDDNPKYLYGVDKPNETLGDYDDVINKLKDIADENKSENVKLMEEANVVREQKGMDLIPIDRSNIQGTTERLYRDIRLNGGDWESLKKVLSTDNTNKTLYEYIEKYAEPVFTINDVDITDDFINNMNASIEYNQGFEGVRNPQKLTKESILNLILYDNPSAIGGARTDVILNESGIRKIAQSIQENLLKAIETQVEFIKQNYNITDPVFLNAWAEEHKKDILQNKFVDNVAALINPENTPMPIRSFYNKNTGQITFMRDYDASARQGLANFLNTRNPFFLDSLGLIDGIGLVSGGRSQNLVDNLFEGYEEETTRDFFMENTENFGDKLNQKAAYLDENGILHFQTNHGAAGPSENALNLIEYMEERFKNNPDVKNITEYLPEQTANFLDRDLKYVTPHHSGPDGLVGKVFYTTTNPFVGMGYGMQNANSNTPSGQSYDIKKAIDLWLKENYLKGNDEAVNEIIEIAKKFGIVIKMDRPDLSLFTDREDIVRNQTEFKIKSLDGSDLNLGAATVSNIQGEVHVDNVLFANQSVKAGNKRAKLRRFYTAALEQFDNWWIDELNTPRRIFDTNNHVFGLGSGRYDVLNNRFITYENKTENYTLSDDYKQIIAYDQLKPIEGAVDVSTPARYYEWLEINDGKYKPMVSSLVGFGEYNRINIALSGSEQLKQNQIVLANKIFELIGVDVKEGGIGPQPSLKKGQAGQIADYLDSIHSQFSINQSIQIQELANYFRVSEALKEGDYDTAKKLLPGLVIPKEPTLEELMIDVDTDEALYRSQFTNDVQNIIDDIDNELIYYLDKRNNKNNPFNFTDKLETIEYKALGRQDDTAYGITYKENQKWIEADRDYNRNNETIELSTSEQIDKKRQRIYNFAEANNIKINLNTDNDVIEFLDTASRFSLFTKNSEKIIDTLETDKIIFALAGNHGYEVILGTGGGNVGQVPHYMIGLIDPNNTLETNEVKTLKAKVVNIAQLNELEAQEFRDIQGKNLSELTDSEFRLLARYMDPSVLETQITDEAKENFIKTITDNQVLFSQNIGIGSIVDGPNQTVDITLLMLDEEITRVSNAVQTGQAPKELLENLLNQYAVTLANAPEDVKAKILTAGNKSLDLLNHYGIKGVKGIGQAARFGFKLADRYDWAVLGPAFIDILSSRISGSGTQFQTIGGALGDTMYRYEDVETNSVMELLYGNKNVQEATGLFGLNIAYPVVNAINFGKDAFKTHIYDNNFLGIESLFTFLKPKAIEALKTVTDQAGLNDWVYNVKRDLIVDTLMKDNNVPYTKENVDFYTKYYEENNPRTTDRYGNELPANYEQNWVSSRPSNPQSSGFSTDERIRTGQRYSGAGGGGGQKKE